MILGKYSKAEDFFRDMRPLIQAELQRQGIDDVFTDYVLAHFAHESAGGTHIPTDYNYAGQTAGKNEAGRAVVDKKNGKTYKYKTFKSLQDFVQSQITRLKNQFHAFDGGIEDYVKNIKKYKYFEANLTNYTNAVGRWYSKITGKKYTPIRTTQQQQNNTVSSSINIPQGQIATIDGTPETLDIYPTYTLISAKQAELQDKQIVQTSTYDPTDIEVVYDATGANSPQFTTVPAQSELNGDVQGIIVSGRTSPRRARLLQPSYTQQMRTPPSYVRNIDDQSNEPEEEIINTLSDEDIWIAIQNGQDPFQSRIDARNKMMEDAGLIYKDGKWVPKTPFVSYSNTKQPKQKKMIKKRGKESSRNIPEEGSDSRASRRRNRGVEGNDEWIDVNISTSQTYQS